MGGAALEVMYTNEQALLFGHICKSLCRFLLYVLSDLYTSFLTSFLYTSFLTSFVTPVSRSALLWRSSFCKSHWIDTGLLYGSLLILLGRWCRSLHRSLLRVTFDLYRSLL